MSHWMRTRSDLTSGKFSCTSNNASGKDELQQSAAENCNLRDGLKVLRSDEGLGVMETISSKTINDSLLLNSEILGNSREICDQMLEPRPVVGYGLERGKSVDVERGFRFPNFPSKYDISSRSCKFLDEGSSKNPVGWMKTSSAEDICFAASKPLQETFVGSSSHVEKLELNKRKSETYSLKGKGAIVSNKKLKNANLRVLEHEACNENTDLLCERKKDGQPQLDSVIKECFRGSNTPILFNNPSTSDYHHYATFDQEDLFQKIHKCSSLRLSPDQYIDSEKTRAEKSFYDCYSLDHKLQNCLHNVETMRICTTLEEGTPRGYPRFTQTSRSFLITKMTDVNLLNECDIFNTTGVIARANGNTPSALHSVSQFYNPGKGGVILHALSSSTDSEGKGNASKFTIKDEPLAGTDSVEFFQENNPHSGANYTPPDKAFGRDSNVSHRIDVSSREAESQWPDTKLPDINLEYPALPAAARLAENSGHSSSKTQSLDMEIFIAHAEQLPTPKSYICSNDSPNSDPGNRWVNRLKLSSSQSSAQGLKSSNLAENSSDQNMKNYMSRIIESSITSSEPTARKHDGKGTMVSETRGDLSTENEEVMMDPSKKNKELFSHVWMQRWMQNGYRISPKNSGTTVVCDLQQSPRLALENLQKRKFPSIGAMTLMGKAMRGFKPCDLQNRGSFTVWNA